MRDKKSIADTSTSNKFLAWELFGMMKPRSGTFLIFVNTHELVLEPNDWRILRIRDSTRHYEVFSATWTYLKDDWLSDQRFLKRRKYVFHVDRSNNDLNETDPMWQNISENIVLTNLNGAWKWRIWIDSNY